MELKNCLYLPYILLTLTLPLAISGKKPSPEA